LRRYARNEGHNEAPDFLEKRQREINPNDPAYLWNRHDITTEEVRRYIAAGDDVNYGDRCPTPLQQIEG
jgi:hypothetical protein